MQMEPILSEWMVLETKTNITWSLLSPAPLLFWEKMSIADCFTCLCSAHSFLGAGNYRGADSKQSSVKCREGLEKSHHCLHLTNITKATWRMNKVKTISAANTNTWYHFSVSLLSELFDPNCNMSPKPVPRSCFESERNSFSCVAVVMSHMRTALTWAWTHQLKWSCSLSCRRQTVVAAD